MLSNWRRSEYRNIALMLVGLLFILLIAFAIDAKAQTPSSFTLRGWFFNQPTCVVKGIKVPYALQVQNISDHVVTAKISPHGYVGNNTTWAKLAGASPSLRGTPPYYLSWEITLKPGQVSRTLRIEVVYPTNVFGARDHGGVFNLTAEIMDTANEEGALELIAHATECMK